MIDYKAYESPGAPETPRSPCLGHNFKTPTPAPEFVFDRKFLDRHQVYCWIMSGELKPNHVEESALVKTIQYIPQLLEWTGKVRKSVQLELVKHDPSIIGRIRNPHRETQILAVSIDPTVIDFIVKPCSEAKSLAAILA